MSSSRTNRKGGQELAPGTMLSGRYRIEEQIDEGGMASIFSAIDIQTNTRVAVKCLYRMYNDNSVVRERFIDEGRIQQMLTHPNILRVYEVVRQPALSFVMEYVDGGSLEDYLKTRGTLGVDEIIDLVIPVLSALGLAHSRGIIHRDLKPSNILLQRAPGGGFAPKVMDFGVAKLNRPHDLTATGTTVGTLHYMSPEQIVGSKKIDGRADIYSMGITLYKLCVGEVPFNASTEFALMMAQVEAAPTPPSQINPKVDPDFEAVLLRALRKRPVERFQTIREFTEALVALRVPELTEETLETANIPVELLRYALGADVVAVDMTEDIVLQSLSDSERALRASLVGSTAMRSPLHAFARTEEEEEQATATVELDALSLEELRAEDGPSGPNTVPLPGLMRTERIPFDDMETFEHPQVRTTPLKRPSKGRFFDKWKLPEADGEATHLIAPLEDLDEPTLKAGTTASSLLKDIGRAERMRRPDLKDTVLDMSESAPTLLRLPDRRSVPVQPTPPPKTVGSSYVDTQENTTPTIVDDDFGRSLSRQPLPTESMPELDERALRDLRQSAPDEPWARPEHSQRAQPNNANLSTSPPVPAGAIAPTSIEQVKILGAALIAFILVLTSMYVVYAIFLA